MSDLTTEFYWHCSTAECWSKTITGSKGDLYTVRWDNLNHKSRFEVQFDWSCTCKGYKLRKGYCSHILKVIEQRLRCGWSQFTDGDNIVEKDGKGCCPRCGEGVHSMGWAV